MRKRGLSWVIVVYNHVIRNNLAKTKKGLTLLKFLSILLVMIKASTTLPENLDKTKELFVYVANRLKDKPTYGATMLNKALYFIDNLSYMKTGKPISGFKYVKQDFGPTPNPQHFLPIKESLIENKEIEEIKSDFFGRLQKKCIPLREPDIDKFSKEEIYLMDNLLAGIANHNATSISEFSHTFMAWELASNMDELPFFTFLLTSKLPSENDVNWATGKIKEINN